MPVCFHWGALLTIIKHVLPLCSYTPAFKIPASTPEYTCMWYSFNEFMSCMQAICRYLYIHPINCNIWSTDGEDTTSWGSC